MKPYQRPQITQENSRLPTKRRQNLALVGIFISMASALATVATALISYFEINIALSQLNTPYRVTLFTTKLASFKTTERFFGSPEFISLVYGPYHTLYDGDGGGAYNYDIPPIYKMGSSQSGNKLWYDINDFNHDTVLWNDITQRDMRIFVNDISINLNCRKNEQKKIKSMDKLSREMEENFCGKAEVEKSSADMINQSQLVTSDMKRELRLDKLQISPVQLNENARVETDLDIVGKQSVDENIRRAYAEAGLGKPATVNRH